MEKSIGPINSIVLARAGESDKIYKKDQNSIDKNGLCELMIKENQFMNFNDRVDYLQELSDKLFSVEYYLNDFVSTGIMYYDLLDMYNIEIFGKTYNCLMLNDEQDITQGLEENIHTDRPETSETDYKKADTTDRKINKTYLIVDKQNQKIEGVISQIGDRSEKTTTITADIDGLNSKVSDIEDLTNTESGTKIITLKNCIAGNLLKLNIKGNNTVFDYLTLSDDLILSDDLYLKGDSIIVVTDSKGNSKEYELGIEDVLRQNGTVYDEYILKDGKAQIIRRINSDGSIKDNEEIEDLGKLEIILKEGTNTISIENYSAEIYAKYATKNNLTDTFATKVELSTSITQTSTAIMTKVNKKVDEEEFGTKIEQNSEAVKLAWNQISDFIQMMIINGNVSLAILDENNNTLMNLDKEGQHFYNDGNSMDIGSFDCYYPIYGNEYKSLMFALNEKATNNFMAWGYKTVSENGDISYTPVIYLGGTSDADYGFHVDNDLFLNLNSLKFKNSRIFDNNDSLMFEVGEDLFIGDTRDSKEILSVYRNQYGTKTLKIFGDINKPIMIDDAGNLVMAGGSIFLDQNGYIDCIGLNQTSLEEKKKNFEKMQDDALSIIKKIDIYKYNLKSEKDTDKKHIGFVIGDNYNYSKEVTSLDNTGVDNYSFTSLCCKAIQEQQKQIEELKKEIEKLKGAKE